MSFMERLTRRWDSRREENGFVTGARDIVVEGSVSIVASREEVWRFLRAPEAAVITSDDVVKVFRVPGTPLDAEGEQWVHAHERDGLLDPQILEVVVFEPVARVVEVSRTIPLGFWSELILSDIPEGTCLTSRQGMKTVNPDLGMGLDDPDTFEIEARTRHEDWLIRVKRAIESGVCFPSQTSTGDV